MSVQDEYQRFLAWLAAGEHPDDVRRVAKIVGANLGTIIPAPSNGGRRAVVLTPLIRAQLPGIDPVIDAHNLARGTTLPWNRLQRLTVGPFRGFRYQEEFTFDRRVVLVYGPNGAGKSSLCEALEFSLLGEVEEAGAKRLAALPDYFRNIHDGGYAPPELTSAGPGVGVAVAPAPAVLRFALIEKNRIDGFARIAARRPTEADALIASLFGLEAFNSFVNNFTTNLDTQLLLATPRAQELAARRALLADATVTLDGRAIAVAGREQEEQALAAEFDPETTYAGLRAQLGLGEVDGRLQQVAAQLEEDLPALSGVSPFRLKEARRRARDAVRELGEQQAALDARAAEVSYSDLYNAVLALHPESGDACPACTTPLADVRENPFERATRGLAGLEGLAEVERARDVARGQAARLEAEFRRVFHEVNGDQLDVAGPDAGLEEAALNVETWRQLLQRAKAAHIRDLEIMAAQGRRAELVAERRRLDGFRERAIAVDERRRLLQERIAAAQARVDGFAGENAELIAAVAAEAANIEFEGRIRVGYAGFREAVEAYRDSLPEVLLADLNDSTRDLYNDFNRDDDDADKLERVVLPLRGGERIQIAFRGAPEALHDALHVLSEGHLRCLGLAILLAKNIALELPLIVFDDAVNAIDHDHRAGIRNTLFGDPRLANKQLIVTCHSNEFIKDIHQQLEEGDTKLYVLRPHDGNHQPRVSDGTSRSYVVKARAALGQGDHRAALAACRQALENLSQRMWKNLGPERGRLALTLRSPDSKPELHDLVTKLDGRVRPLVEDGTLQGRWPDRSRALQDLVAIPQATMAWSYLNKGTHDEEDREDFEEELVERIVDAIGRISVTFN